LTFAPVLSKDTAMATATLTIDLDAIAANWRALDALSSAETQTAAVLKADAYGLGMPKVARALAMAGARRFFVALAEEGVVLRQTLGMGPQISVLSGHLPGDAAMIDECDLTPILNSIDQITRQFETLPGRPFGVQLDTGMNRLGLEADEWAAVAELVLRAEPEVVLSHLACADEPDHPMNAQQLAEFHRLTDGISVPRCLAATGGILLGPDYHFDLTRPGIGLYAGHPFVAGRSAVRLTLPIIQVREVVAGESVGYGCNWTAPVNSMIATVAAGYADGISRRLSNVGRLWDGDSPCPIVGRVSMDMITVDISHLPAIPDSLDIIGPYQGADDLAADAGTIGYEVLTSLGPRYARRYRGGLA
jgi:alanine racemase